MLTQVTYLWPYMDYALSSIMHGGNMVITLMGCQHTYSNAAMMMTKVDARQTMDWNNKYWEKQFTALSSFDINV